MSGFIPALFLALRQHLTVSGNILILADDFRVGRVTFSQAHRAYTTTKTKLVCAPTHT